MTPDPATIEARIARALEAIARACEKAQAEYLADRDAREAAKLAARGPFWWQDNEP